MVSIAKILKARTRGLGKFVDEHKIDLVIVGPEKPLVEGVVDFLSNKNVKVFGPNKIPSQLEGSKIFTKKICEKYNIPTANFGIFQNPNESKIFLEKLGKNFHLLKDFF